MVASNNNFGTTFHGRKIVHPGAYDNIDASSMTISSEDGHAVPIVIGTANAGVPGELRWFHDSPSAREYLRGGDLATAVDLMFSPIPEGGGGASVVGVIVANNNTRATITVGNIVIHSKEYGADGNKVQVKLEDGSIPGSKIFTAYRWDLDEIEVYNNVGAVMKLQYTGDKAYADASITITDGKATALAIRTGDDKASAVIDVSINLTDTRYDTVYKVIRYLSSLSGYSASYLNKDSASMNSALLDATTDMDIKTANYLLGVSGDLHHIVNKISSLVEIQDVPTSVNNFAYKSLSGGQLGVAPSSWEPFFNTVKKTFSKVLVALTSDEVIHAEASRHIANMEMRGQKQVLFTGGGIGETASQAKQRAMILNNSRVISAYPPIYHKLEDSGKTVLPAYMTGALIAGRVCGVPRSEPITFDHFDVVGLGEELIGGDPVIDDLLNAGVCTLEKVMSGGIRLVQGLTTYTGSNNALYREISVRMGADDISETVTKKLEETFVGTKGLNTTSAVETVVIDTLDEAVREEEIAGYDKKSITVKFANGAIDVDYKVAPAEPINFVLVNSRFVPEQLL